MAYDEALAQRLRDGLRGTKGVTEKRMMGGLCLLLNGNMLGGIDRTKSGRDRFMFRVGKENEAKALRRPGASIVEMGGRRMGGLIFVESDVCDHAVLKEWLSMTLDYVAHLPKK